MEQTTEKFTPADGRSLTPYEREILTILQEECAEVIVAASKLLRFGIGNTNPTTRAVNTAELGMEVGDLVHMLQLIEKSHIVDPSVVSEGILRKKRRLSVYLQSVPTT